MGYSDFGESKYEFYDRTANPEFSWIRNLLNNIYSNYPNSDQRDLELRFQSEYDQVVYEMLIHEIFTNLRYKSIIHPKLKDVATTPDFLFYNDNYRFYIEAKHTVEIEQSAREDSIESSIYQTFNEISSNDFIVSIDELDIFDSAYPSMKRLRKFIEDDLSSKTAKDQNIISETIEYSEKAFRILYRLIPINKSNNEINRLTIGSTQIKSRFGTSTKSILKSILKKSGKYGEIGLPFIIALNFKTNWGLHSSDIKSALYGGLIDNQHEESVFYTNSRPQCKRISAVIVSDIAPNSLFSKSINLYHNPFAKYPIGKEVFPFSQTKLESNRIIDIPGIAINEILNKNNYA